MSKNTVMRNKIDPDIKADVWDKTGGRCWYCGVVCNPFKRRAYCIDHMTPISKGGGDDIENLVPCCLYCNTKKNNKTIEEFRAFIENKAAFTSAQKKIITDKFGDVPAMPPHIFWFEGDMA